MLRTFQALSVATCAFAMLASPALAADSGRQHVAVTVHYGDLNLASKAGATVLIRRLEQAARQACGDEPGARGVRARSQQTCRTEAVTKAVANINNAFVWTVLAEEPDTRMMVASR